MSVFLKIIRNQIKEINIKNINECNHHHKEIEPHKGIPGINYITTNPEFNLHSPKVNEDEFITT